MQKMTIFMCCVECAKSILFSIQLICLHQCRSARSAQRSGMSRWPVQPWTSLKRPDVGLQKMVTCCNSKHQKVSIGGIEVWEAGGILGQDQHISTVQGFLFWSTSSISRSAPWTMFDLSTMIAWPYMKQTQQTPSLGHWSITTDWYESKPSHSVQTERIWSN